MFVLRYKPDTKKLLWSSTAKAYVLTDIGGKYFTSIPSMEEGHSTTDLSKATVYSDENEVMTHHIANCEKVAVRVELV